MIEDRIYLGASKGAWGYKYINFWIDTDGNIVRDLDDINIYANIKHNLTAQDREKFATDNYNKVKSVLYGDMPEDYIEAPSHMTYMWIRDTIRFNGIQTVSEFKVYAIEHMFGGFNFGGADIDTLDKFINKSSLSRFVNETKQKGVFDQVIVEMSLIQGNKTREEMTSFIKQHKKAIKLKAVDTLRNSRKYNRYGVPVNFLKYERMVLTRDNVLELTFALKIEAE